MRRNGGFAAGEVVVEIVGEGVAGLHRLKIRFPLPDPPPHSLRSLGREFAGRLEKWRWGCENGVSSNTQRHYLSRKLLCPIDSIGHMLPS